MSEVDTHRGLYYIYEVTIIRNEMCEAEGVRSPPIYS